VDRWGHNSIHNRHCDIFVYEANCRHCWLLRKPDAIEARVSRAARSELNFVVRIPISLPIGLPRDCERNKNLIEAWLRRELELRSRRKALLCRMYVYGTRNGIVGRLGHQEHDLGLQALRDELSASLRMGETVEQLSDRPT
jgi:hypothetical protein